MAGESERRRLRLARRDRPQRSRASFIQSIYFEFGSGCVLPETGVLWQNRAAAFSLDPDLVAALERAGHEVEMLPDDISDTVGHAGLITRRPDGGVDGAHDPRGDGASEEG